MIIDTHSHLNFKAYDGDRDEVIKRAQKEDIFCIDVGVNHKTSKAAVDLSKKSENIFSAVGVHPSEVGENFGVEKYKGLAKSKKVVAIGEIGLDYYRNPDKEKQKQVFVEQLKLAEELNLPVIIHCRMAQDDVFEILKNRNLRGTIHCFTGSWGDAQKYLELGFYLGFNGIIYKLNLENVIKNCPLDKILLETDCPYLTPSAGGNKRNEPVFVKYIAETIAKIKNISYERISEITTQNARGLFKI